MILRNLHILPNGGIGNIYIRGDEIVSKNLNDDDEIIEFDGALAFPGLINSHEHLEFNSFPSLKNGNYSNYTQWGKDIHQNNKEEIEAVLKIPLEERINFGIYKNLVNGFTTVVNHGTRLTIPDSSISIFQGCTSLHSVSFEKNWKWKLMRASRNIPVVIHVGEGIDKKTYEEIDQLLRWNILKKKLIAVHGIAMNERQAGHFEALVWCPASNYFLFGKTADISILKKKLPVIFGSDSTLTSPWNIWEHLRLARKTGMVTDDELFEMLTTKPASVWGFSNKGPIEEGKVADIVVARKKMDSLWDSFYSIDPDDILLVVTGGRIRMTRADLYEKSGLGKKMNYFKKGENYFDRDLAQPGNQISKTPVPAIGNNPPGYITV